MEIMRFNDARRYDAPGHYDMRGLRLQGFDASTAGFAWTGLSHFLPGGGAEMDASPLEKIYVVIEGAVTIELGDGTCHILRPFDSCFIGAGEARAIRNEGNAVASMLVVMPYPEART
ncbi:cupin domain-containing protein [Sphingomonas canadensis]|uniref:Cupin domain-containing protein n=1 Tax=Sphingomonas canadensis TaxID=1219257 RepID=A0ABW3H5S1_9SPHN|nr:cupin domain-containing protein [Sphingomonas canadensis]MCW3836202.1 cupin domain-containing protein [Sphingomonas canadensis]